MQYTFFDRDFFSNGGDYNITGDLYDTLLQVCVQYSYCFSVVVKSDCIPIVQELKKWRIPAPFVYKGDNSGEFPVHFYRCCEETRSIIRKNSNDLFDFYYLRNHAYPEDISFYRLDGTTFFDSVIHEGECSIYPRTDEDVSQILKFGHWLPINARGMPEIPACSVQLTPPLRAVVIKDPFYLLLRDVQSSPSKYLDLLSIDSLDALIKTYRPPDFDNSFDTHSISFLPRWYTDFKFYVLKVCGALTTAEIPEAFSAIGLSGADGLNKYYNLLDTFVDEICIEQELI